VKVRARTVMPYGLVAAMVVLAAGTISNQLKINAANQRFADQARNGQRSLTRQCQLVPIGLKTEADALRRHVITAHDFQLYVSTAALYCPPRRR
jgi:hypothetical protein